MLDKLAAYPWALWRIGHDMIEACMDTSDAISKSVCRWFIGATRLLYVSVMLLCTDSISAFAQSTPPYAIQGGLSVGLELAQTSAWDVELSPPNAPRSTISDATGLALIVSYGITSWSAPWISYAVSLYGESDPSAISELTAGLELRGPWFRRFVPSVGLGFGRTTAPTAGGFSFSHADLAAGAEFFAQRRLALRAGLHSLIPIGKASGSSNSGSTSFDVAHHRTQLRLGMRLHLGSSD